MDAIVEHSLPVQPAPMRTLVYDGRLGELYGLFWRNLLLTVLTLGLYRFWAVTRNRHYLWAHMRFDEDRFEYVGSGSEKLWGFLKVVLLIILLYGGAVALVALLPGRSGLVKAAGFGVGLCAAVLAAAAPFTALRYRLARTRWRGLGGGASGSALGYGINATLISVAVVLTATLLLPWGRLRLAERRIAASEFADTRLAFHRATGLAFVPYLGALVLKVAVFAALIGAGTAIFLAVRPSLSGPPKPEVAAGIGQWAGIVVFLVLREVNRLCNSWFDAAVLRRVLERTRYLDLRLHSQISGSALLGLRVGNLLITVLTLGLGTPLVRQRCAQFVARGVGITGTLDVDRLHREARAPARDAEGLFAAFDVGFLY